MTLQTLWKEPNRSMFLLRLFPSFLFPPPPNPFDHSFAPCPSSDYRLLGDHEWLVLRTEQERVQVYDPKTEAWSMFHEFYLYSGDD
jgi:hypothetical protein